jgi:alpha-glucosidase
VEEWAFVASEGFDPPKAEPADLQRVGRDGCRVPLPWESGVGAANGFNSTGKAWLSQPEIYASYSRNLQEGVAGSTLELYKQALKLRKDLQLGEGSFDWLPQFVKDHTLGYRNDNILVIHNFGHEPVSLPPGQIIASSIEGMTDGDSLVADQTVWLKLH